jgi:hypothetical protein
VIRGYSSVLKELQSAVGVLGMRARCDDIGQILWSSSILHKGVERLAPSMLHKGVGRVAPSMLHNGVGRLAPSMLHKGVGRLAPASMFH